MQFSKFGSNSHCYPTIQLSKSREGSSRALPCNFCEQAGLGGSTLIGGGKRARTADPLLAKQVLSQLSYTPAGWWA